MRINIVRDQQSPSVDNVQKAREVHKVDSGIRICVAYTF
jgi:hypothetical protein